MNQTIEQKFTWESLDESYKLVAVVSHAKALRTDKLESLVMIFNAANPEIIFGNTGDQAYCKIAPESVELVKKLVKEYLV